VYRDEAPWVSAKESLLWSAYFFGWGVTIFTLYRYFCAPVRPIHVLATVKLTSDEKAAARLAIEERKQEMEKFGISAGEDADE
jgi:hypothetical protein